MTDPTSTDPTSGAFATHYPRLVAVAMRVVGDRATAEEVAADALARMDRAPVAAGRDAVAAWLTRVTINAALNAVRTRRREHDRVAAAARRGDAPGLPTTPTPSPEEVAAAADERAQVREVLAALPERQAIALLLRHSGHSYAEIAETLGVATGSVGVILARGERAFRRRWESLP